MISKDAHVGRISSVNAYRWISYKDSMWVGLLKRSMVSVTLLAMSRRNRICDDSTRNGTFPKQYKNASLICYDSEVRGNT